MRNFASEMKTLIHNACRADLAGDQHWVLINDDKIESVGEAPALPAADAVIDANGALLMPGVIDCHVHFRDPGLIHKADMESESKAALAGGVTSIFDMPNTKPATVSLEAWREKCRLAAEKCQCNYAFFIGATNDNISTLLQADYRQVPGVKLFMGSSTGNMLVDDQQAIERIFSQVDAIVAVHAEDQSIIDANIARAREQYPDGVPVAMHSQIRSVEACYRSSELAVKLALKHRHRLHICHLTTATELALLQTGPIHQKIITSEVSPHHLLWCDEDYSAKGSRIKMNPAVKSRADRDALRQALRDGLIDMVATDHAPHLLADKQGDALTAASGAPLIQFSLPLMLSLFEPALVQRVMCENPARVYGIQGRGYIQPGCYADLTLVRRVEPYRVSDADVVSRCGWTPLDGVSLEWRVERTWVNGGTEPMPLAFAKDMGE